MAENTRRRLGLALSGGGFRASLFHLGVLAKMAEMDLLRHVEAISTVSGGSIIGALYYLQLKKLLEEKEDRAIAAQDYVTLVDAVMLRFLTAIQRNIRMRAYADIASNLRMAFSKRYTRSDRLAQLYDEMLYAPTAEEDPRLSAALRGRRHERCKVRMTDLLIVPKGVEREFDPVTANAERSAKVPMLYVNSTCLNTGRRWMFTPTWMGEQFGEARKGDPDVNTVLRGFYYKDATDKYRDLPLSVAVAASAGVPGLFPPLPLTDLYPDWIPQLVDGGVRDNLGLTTLDGEFQLDFLVSDASDPMDDARMVAPLTTSVLLRTGWVMWDRLRDQTVTDAWARNEPVVYAKGGIPVTEVRPFWEGSPTETQSVLRTGMDPRVIEAIARIRTDLDTFGDVEADALMGAGYLMTEAQLRLPNDITARFPPAAQPLHNGWIFNWILPELKDPPAKLIQALRAARYRFTKTIQLPIRAIADRLLEPASALERFCAGKIPERPTALSRATAHLELAALDVGGELTEIARNFAIRALTAAGELGLGTLMVPFALADLALVNWVYLGLERRPHPSPNRPALWNLTALLRRAA